MARTDRSGVNCPPAGTDGDLGSHIDPYSPSVSDDPLPGARGDRGGRRLLSPPCHCPRTTPRAARTVERNAKLARPCPRVARSPVAFRAGARVPRAPRGAVTTEVRAGAGARGLPPASGGDRSGMNCHPRGTRVDFPLHLNGKSTRTLADASGRRCCLPRPGAGGRPGRRHHPPALALVTAPEPRPAAQKASAPNANRANRARAPTSRPAPRRPARAPAPAPRPRQRARRSAPAAPPPTPTSRSWG